LEPVRLATEKEIEMLKGTGMDTTFTHTVLAFGEGDSALYSLIKNVTEIYTYPMDVMSSKRNLMFMWAMENIMRINGVPAYYFQTSSKEEKELWRKNIESFGAEKTNPEPEFRYRKAL
jgi:hypothetical protein